MAENPIITIALRGELTSDTLRPQLALAEEQMEAVGGQVSLLFDCSSMTGYAPDARSEFVHWNQEHKEKVGAVAIVTDRSLWRMVISAMALASRQDMRAFEEVPEARTWLSKARR